MEDLCSKFNINRVKKKVVKSIDDALDNLDLQSHEACDKENMIMSFIDKLIQDHKKNRDREPQDVFLLALGVYKRHLKELESRDIISLKRQIQQLQQIKIDLLHDLDDENRKEQDFWQQREEIDGFVDPKVVMMHRQCEMLKLEVEETKNDYRNLEGGNGY